MTRQEKLIWYATAPRASAAQFFNAVDGDLVVRWVPKLRGRIVCLDSKNFKFLSRAEAVNEARAFREACRRDARAEGLID